MQDNPCLTCGACCAFFRVSFYWAEADDASEGGIPVHLTEDLGPFRRVMKGTNVVQPRCVALEGTIGNSVLCSIYENRPSVCRTFELSWKENVHNISCDEARNYYGLAALTPPNQNDPDDPGHYPRAA
ncbi:MAG: YkgJ family cysteine cluster protein [bacterium]|nr:MAG: YkgJ family cysteine cluster protein [bacterium]